MFNPLCDFITPPRRLNHQGAPRRVGVEIEFAGLTARAAAERIAAHIGGTIAAHDPHRFDIEGASLGTFRAELDSRYAHPEGVLPKFVGDTEPWLGSQGWLTKIGVSVSEAFGHAGAAVIPCEVSTPPLPFDALPAVDRLVTELRDAGARGTGESSFYAFGLHLNPEIATTDPAWIVSIIRAEIVLSPWLRSVMTIDASRDLSGFVTPFPRGYIDLVAAAAYAPGVERLIADYISHNPTRQRELDLLPLFAWLDRERTLCLLPREKITPRPAFHYRLPNAALERRDWSVALEWNRWCLVERLAEEPDLLNSIATDYHALLDAGRADDWPTRSTEWLTHVLHSKL